MRWKTIVAEESGNVTVLVAFAIVVIIGMAALTVDGGIMFYNKACLAKAVDAAVLAGAQELPLNPTRAVNQAEYYANLNRVGSSQANFSVSSDKKTITGTAQCQMELYFARVLGFNTQGLTVTSTAHVSPVTSYTGIVPFGIKDQNYRAGQLVTLKQGACNENISGWFGALRLGDSGADTYRDNIKYGYQQKISVGDVLKVEPGDMSGPTSQGIAYRIDGCQHSPACSDTGFKEGCPRIVVVPMGYNNGRSGANGRFTVTGFAAFLVTEYTGSGKDNTVKGAFIRYIIPSDDAEDG
ncbi:MAG: TadE/TadG family type IV pilus assembly protein [Syntrophomonas sp.]